jgi:LEA14-like dessication related protein
MLTGALGTVSGCTMSARDNLLPPTVRLINIQPQSLREGRTLMALSRLRVSNPNGVAVPIDGGMVKMALAGTPVAEGELAYGFVLPANGFEDIDIRVNLDLANSLTVGMALLEGETVLPYSINGYVDVGVAYLGRIPVRESGLVSLNQLRPNNQAE